MFTHGTGDPVQELLEGSISRHEFVARAVSLGLSLSAVAALLRAYDGGTAAASMAPKATAPVSLEIWEQDVSINAAKGAINAFRAKYPFIKTKWVPTPGPQTATKLLATISAGSGAPDVAFVAYTDMSKFTTRDGIGLVDLRGFMSRDGFKLDQWPKWALKLVTTTSGKILGLSTDLGAAGTFYRRDVFEAASLPSQPAQVQSSIKTWDDFIATGKRIAARGKYMLEDATTIFDIVRQQHAQAYFDASGKPIVNNAEFVHAAEVALRARKAKIDLRPANSAESGAAMQAGKVATYFSAAWFDIIIHATAPKTAGKWGTTLLPEKSSANFGGSYYVLPSQGRQQEAAWKLISFLVASKTGLGPYLQASKFLPGWRPAYALPVFTRKDPFYAGQKWLQQFVEAVDHVPSIQLNVNDPIAMDALSHAITDILSNGANIKQRLNQANTEIEQRTRS